jgi:putative flippase GtrA
MIQKIINSKIVEVFGIKKKIKFLFIGGTTFIINYITLFVFKSLIKLGDNVSFTLSFSIGVIYHFSMNKFFVFKEKKLINLRYQIIQYAILTMFNYLTNLGIINLLKFFNITIYIGIIIATIVTMLLTYFVMNKLIFKNNLDVK